MIRSSIAAPPAVALPREGTGPHRSGSAAGPAYLRRYAVQAPRRRHGMLLVRVLLLVALLFSKVWEGTVANALSMERDRLRREVSGLQNRIRLSSELRDQAALKEGIDSQTLRAQGFMAPDPSRIIEIDLRQAMPRALLTRASSPASRRGFAGSRDHRSHRCAGRRGRASDSRSRLGGTMSPRDLRRLRLVAVLGFAAFLVLFGRLVQIQSLDHGRFAAAAKQQQTRRRDPRAGARSDPGSAPPLARR